MRRHGTQAIRCLLWKPWPATRSTPFAPAACEVTLPVNDWVQSGRVVLSTDPAHPVDTKVAAGDSLTVAPRALVLLQQA